MNRRLQLLLICLGIAVASLVVLLSQGHVTLEAGGIGAQANLPDPWPSFVMVYHEDNYGWDSGKLVNYDVYRYTYKGRNNWRHELIESTRDPRSVGTWTSFDGKSFTSGSVGDKQPAAPIIEPSDRPTMATWWLVPVAPDQLGQDDHFKLVAKDGVKIQLRYTETAACDSLPDDWQTRLCSASKQTFVRTTDKLLTADHGIPTDITDHVEGKITKQITAKEIIYSKPASK